MEDRAQSSRLRAGVLLAVFSLLVVLAAVPLLLTPMPPLLDYPNHLARMHLLPWLPSPELGRFYRPDWAPLPNLAMDGVVPFLAMAMPLAAAGKAFILVTFVLLAGGTVMLHRVLFERWTLWPLLGFLLLYSRLLLWGFLGYLFGCGLALTSFAAWVALDDKPWPFRVMGGAVFALATYLAHLLAFALYALMVAGYEWGAILRAGLPVPAASRRLTIGAVPFLPPLALMAMNSSVGRILYANPFRKLDLLFSVFDNYHRAFDVASFVLVVLAFGFAFHRRWIRLTPAMIGPLIALVLFYLVIPSQLMTAAGADRRIPLMIFLVLIAGTSWVARPRLEQGFLVAAMLLFLLRLTVVAVSWQGSGRLYAQLLPAIDALPRGSCIATAYDREGLSVQPTPLAHFPTIAVARRDAFVTSLFAYPMQQPIALQPQAQKLADILSADALWSTFVEGGPALTPAIKQALAQCDFIAFAGTRPFSLKDTSGLAPQFVTPRFQLWRIARPNAAPS